MWWTPRSACAEVLLLLILRPFIHTQPLPCDGESGGVPIPVILDPQDFAVIGVLVFLEGVLSIDNALVLALLARRLPSRQQKRALTYGILGAIILRLAALSAVSLLIQWTWVKFVGGGYLLYISLMHWIKGDDGPNLEEGKQAGFWSTVILMMLLDLAFAVDSILAAFGVSQKLIVICTGAIIGLAFLRFAAGIFVRLLKRFPNFEESAYLLIVLIGAKLILEGFHLPQLDFHSTSHPAFWLFWGMMLLSVLYGFLERVSQEQKRRAREAAAGLKKQEKALAKLRGADGSK